MEIGRTFGISMAVLVWSVAAQGIVDSINRFALRLLNVTSAEAGSPGNLALSAYTVWTLLSVIDEGARGETARQLEEVLGIPGEAEKGLFRNNFKNVSSLISVEDKDVLLDFYNAIVTPAEHKVKGEFLKVSKNDYGVDVQPVDFRNLSQASETINKFASRATRNRIPDFIYPDDLTLAEMKIFVLSALYFKGAWMMPFNMSETRIQEFYDENGNKVRHVAMMHRMAPFPYARIDPIKGYAVELPYGKGDKTSMIVLLPYKHRTLSNMLSLLLQYPFGQILDTLDKAKEFENEEVNVFLPKFSVKSDLNLNLVLHKMGVEDVFNYAKVDLLGMFYHYLSVSRVIQRAEIEVNEQGSVTAAAGGVGIANKIAPATFVATRPFLYFIVNKPSKSILFAGKVSTPL